MPCPCGKRSEILHVVHLVRDERTFVKFPPAVSAASEAELSGPLARAAAMPSPLPCETRTPCRYPVTQRPPSQREPGAARSYGGAWSGFRA